MNRINGVFEGGGVKGVGLVGAVASAFEQDYVFDRVAGTSAGAIVAALIAAGYNAHELTDIMRTIEYLKFKDKDWVDRLPLVGPSLSVIWEKGIYEGNYFEAWLRELLAAKGVKTFGDLVWDASTQNPRKRYRLQVIASDITRGVMLVLPEALKDYGIDPDKFSVAKAVRMSMSIPYFFEPVRLNQSYIVDGGMLSNYPVWIFDEKDEPCPTVGFKLVDPKLDQSHKINGPLSMLHAIVGTMMEAHDQRYITDSDFARTIPIPTLGVRTTEFDLAMEKSNALYHSGFQSCQDRLPAWNFEEYRQKWASAESRTSRLLKV